MRISVLMVLFLLTLITRSSAAQREFFQTTPQTQKYAVIIGGAAAEPIYEQRFKEWTLQLYKILLKEYGYSPEHVTLLFGKGEAAEKYVFGPARKKTIRAFLSKLKKRAQPGDQIFFFLVGHGTSDPEAAKFNLVGPDVTGAEFSAWLRSFSQQDLVVVNTTNSSFPFCLSLSAPGRIIISATRSDSEKYDTVFAGYFIEALKGYAGDFDKNTRLSIWEAFQYAKKGTKKWYTDQDRLPTEHPVLDDNADAVFSLDPNPAENDGRLAQVATLDWLTVDIPKNISVETSKKLKALTAKMLQLERAVLLLRNRKSKLPEAKYRQQLEVLLIDLARTTRRLRILEKRSGQ